MNSSPIVRGFVARQRGGSHPVRHRWRRRGSREPIPENGVTLRNYDVTDGSLLWEHLVWHPVTTAADTVVGTVFVESTTYDLQSAHLFRVSNNTPGTMLNYPARASAGLPKSQTTTWEARLRTIDISDGTFIDSQPFNVFVLENGVNPNKDATIIGENLRVLPNTNRPRLRKGDASGNLVSRGDSGSPRWLMFDGTDLSTSTLTYWIVPSNWTGTGSARYEATIPAFGGDPAITVSWALDATAATIQSALAAVPQITSVSVTGGPLPYAWIKIDIEWADVSLNFSDITKYFGTASSGWQVFAADDQEIIGWESVSLPPGDMGFAVDGSLIAFWSFTGFFSRQVSKIGNYTLKPFTSSGYSWTVSLVNIDQWAVELEDRIWTVTTPSPVPAPPNAQRVRVRSYSTSTGALLTNAEFSGQWPRNIHTTRGALSTLCISTTNWNGMDGSTPVLNQSSTLGHIHDQQLNAPASDLAPTTFMNTGVNSCGATSTLLAFLGGTEPTVDPHTPVAGLGSTCSRREDFIAAGDAFFPLRYFRVSFRVAQPVNYRVDDNGTTEWRISLQNTTSGPGSALSTAWLAHNANEATVQAALNAVFGFHNQIPTWPNVWLSEIGTHTTSISGNPLNYMLWQGRQLRLSALAEHPDDVGLYNMPSPAYTRSGEVTIEVRNITSVRTKSFGAMQWSDGAIVWQDNFGVGLSGSPVLLGETFRLHDSTNLLIYSQTMARPTPPPE